MRVLLDTCTFLWLVTDDPALSQRARSTFADPSAEVFLSAVSVWEIAVKYKLGKLRLPEPPARFVPDSRQRHRIAPLALEEESVLAVERLPDLHRDPFDRMLVCQAIMHGLTILTPDPAIGRYPVPVAW